MSTQIAVRLPEDVMLFVENQVASGAAASRAAVVTDALRREMRHAAAERDIKIYAEHGSDPDLLALAEFAAKTPLVGLD
jgi:Arc/MetJ-type ribon-helix-helix transcriptional regulator